jgi:alpha-amylase
MKTICFIFKIHQPFRLRDYKFFEIDEGHDYFDNVLNNEIMKSVIESSYLPANRLILDLIREYGSNIKIAFSISGTAMEQMEQFDGNVLESFKALADTGNVEFLGQTYNGSLSSLKSETSFINEVNEHSNKIKTHFGQQPEVFLNTGLIYNDDIAKKVANLGFKAIITEENPNILKGHSSNYIYESDIKKGLKLLFKNRSLSNDISLRFSEQNWSEWPLKADKYFIWLKADAIEDQLINIVIDYANLGAHHSKESGIFDFLQHLFTNFYESKNITMNTPSEAIKLLPSITKLSVTNAISEALSEKDLTAWLNNEMQQEAIETLYGLEKDILKIKDKKLLKDYNYLKSADHFYYMRDVNDNYYSPYASAYEAFLTYMNVLSDFTLRVQKGIEKTNNTKLL